MFKIHAIATAVVIGVVALTNVGIAHAAHLSDDSTPKRAAALVAQEKVKEAHERACKRLEIIQARHPQVGLPAFCREAPPPPKPVVTLEASPQTIIQGDTVTLSWSSTNASSCEASGGWSGTRNLSGNEIVSPSATTTYTLTCTGEGGSDDDSATVNVTLDETPLPPTVNLEANPETTAVGSTTTLSWTSTNTTSCDASGDWSGPKSLIGNEIVSPVATSTYTLTCEGAGGSIQDSVVVEVTPLPEDPVLDHIVISEVYYDVLIPDRGTVDSANEWVELYNGSDAPVDVSGWTIGDAASPNTDVLPALSVIPAKSFLIVVASSTTAGLWADTIPPGIPIVNLGGSIGSGMNQDGDAVYLQNGGVTVDAMSYGSNVDVFNPAAPDVVDGHSLRRDNLTADTDTAEDWEDLASPTLGLF